MAAQRARTAPRLRRLVEPRHDRAGELAHASVPDLKEAEGGLRDATVLKALVATWLVDVPHADSSAAGRRCSTCATCVHGSPGGPPTGSPRAVGRPGHASAPADALAAQTYVRELGRRITHLSRLTWRRVDAYLAGPGSAADPADRF